MSSTEIPTKPQQENLPSDLGELRAELDAIDDAIHDLLMRRGEVVEAVAALAPQGKVAFRPGREAEIIRRLLRRHAGGLPPGLLVRLWRELLAATTAMQRTHIVTVCESESSEGFVACAREHFGALTPLRVHRTPAQAIAEVSAGQATAAVLPLPREDENAAVAWWTALLHSDEARIHVVARLPFWTPRSEGAPRAQALVVTASPPDPSSRDRSLLGLELPPELSRARLSTALAGAGFAPRSTILRRERGALVAQALVEVDGFADDDDTRLTALTDVRQRPVVLGAYAVPLEGENA